MSSETAPMVGIIMGSSSDMRIMRGAAEALDELGIRHEDQIVSAHRTPSRLSEYAQHAEKSGFRAIIAGAGGAAHLPGMISSYTTIPVIGVPILVYADKGEGGGSRRSAGWMRCCQYRRCPRARRSGPWG